jgi:hypothetical protein
MSPALIYSSTEQFVQHHLTKFTWLEAVTILTFRNPASYIKDGHTATLNTHHFLYFFQQIHVLNFLNMLHNLNFFLFKMPFIS